MNVKNIKYLKISKKSPNNFKAKNLKNILTFLSFYIKYKKILIDYLIENILECNYWLVLFLMSKLWFYIFQLPQYQKETWYNLLSANEPELYVVLELLYEQTFSENFCWCRWFCCFCLGHSLREWRGQGAPIFFFSSFSFSFSSLSNGNLG